MKQRILRIVRLYLLHSLFHPPSTHPNTAKTITNHPPLKGTVWPPTSGSTLINGSHPSALTAINLALGANATNFNISLVPLFNQTGAGTFCLSETGRANLDQGFKDAGYTGADDERINGLMASVQVIQLGHSGSALYNVRNFPPPPPPPPFCYLSIVSVESFFFLYIASHLLNCISFTRADANEIQLPT